MEIKKRRILIVDDDPDVTKTFGLVLEDNGLYEVDIQRLCDCLAEY
jgi:hypothetical protein